MNPLHIRMRRLLQLTAFGAASGLVWSLVPLVLSELYQSAGEIVSVLSAGTLTGITVTLILAGPLSLSRRRTAVMVGAASLPLGAFLFGVIVSWVHLGLWHWSGTTYRFVEHRFDPLEAGWTYLVSLSWIPWFAAILFPLAVVTTILLHHSIHRIQHQ